MSQIIVSNLTFSYDGSYDNVFENVSFALDTNWKLGFCARNGRGKTTFLKLLTGKYEYSGKITSSVNFEYFPFDVTNPGRTALEILREICPEAQEWQINREISKLSLSDDTLCRPFSTLSNGERTKILLAALFLRENSFLLIDEPTNHLDLTGRDIVSNYLNSKNGFILVSHDRAFLDNCVDHILSINKTNIEVQTGNFSSWQYNKQIQDEFESARNKQLKSEISRLESAVQRTAKWSDKAERAKTGIDPKKVDVKSGYAPKQAAKAKKLMARSKAVTVRRNNSIVEKSKLLRNIESADELKLHPPTLHTPKLLYVEELCVDYGSGSVFESLSFEIQKGDRTAIQGGNGCGKSSLLKLLCGFNIPHTGRAVPSSGLKISYVPQDHSGLNGNLDDYAETANIDKTLFRAILRKLDFSRAQFDKELSDFSAGQKKKVLLAHSLCDNAHLYIWDEPLNYIDILSRMQIEELILKYNPTLLFVEHDRAFCDKISTKSITVSKYRDS